MAKVEPFHSTRDNDPNVYHDHDGTPPENCTEGNNIEPQNRAPGTGGYPLCKNCADLS